MAQTDLQLPQVKPLGQTSRTDRWWLVPLLTFLGLGAFIVYATWAALQNSNYFFDGYLSPMYSPLLWDVPGQPASGHVWLGSLLTGSAEMPEWFPAALFFPAFMILWGPGGFRFTCYYYRGAYYKAFWQDPTNCGVGEPKFRGRKYRGERSFPLVFQNLHRYFMYVAIIFIFFLAYDAILGYFHTGGDGSKGFGVHVGSLVLTMNVVLLGGYTFGCHSFRHLVGGGMDILSGRPIRKKTYDCVSCLNRGHMRWAWASLFWVGFTDFYIRMCAMGVFTDFRILGA